MKTAVKTMLLIALVVGIVFVAGCTQSSGDYTATPPPSGGGCGVSAPQSESNPVAETAINEIATTSSL